MEGKRTGNRDKGSGKRRDIPLSFGAGTLCNLPSAEHTPEDPPLRHSTIVSDRIGDESVTRNRFLTLRRVEISGSKTGVSTKGRGATDLHKVLEEGVTSTSTYHMRDIVSPSYSVSSGAIVPGDDICYVPP